MIDFFSPFILSFICTTQNETLADVSQSQSQLYAIRCHVVLVYSHYEKYYILKIQKLYVYMNIVSPFPSSTNQTSSPCPHTHTQHVMYR